jgi:hypothetical protein
MVYFSITDIAHKLGESLERVQYVIRRNSIPSACVCGGRRGYNQQQLKTIQSKLNKVRKYTKQN